LLKLQCKVDRRAGRLSLLSSTELHFTPPAPENLSVAFPDKTIVVQVEMYGQSQTEFASSELIHKKCFSQSEPGNTCTVRYHCKFRFITTRLRGPHTYRSYTCGSAFPLFFTAFGLSAPQEPGSTFDRFSFRIELVGVFSAFSFSVLGQILWKRTCSFP
jgi:hypothetical protein